MAFTKDGPGNGRNSISPIIDKMYGLSFISKKDDDTVKIMYDKADTDYCSNCDGGGSAQVEKEEDIIL